MKRLGLWSLEVALVLACGVGTARAWGPPPGLPASGGLGTHFGRTPAPVEKPVAVAKRPAPPPAPPKDSAIEKKPAPRPPSQVDEAAMARDQELQTLLRRQKVCLQLMQIAVETNDTELLRKAEQLDERARDVYTQRTAHLPASRDTGFESDEKTLEKHLGATHSVSRRPASAAKPTSEARAWEEEP